MLEIYMDSSDTQEEKYQKNKKKNKANLN